MKRGDFRGVMSVIIVFFIIFSILTVIYVRDAEVDNSPFNENMNGSDKGLLGAFNESTNLFVTIMEKLASLFSDKVTDISLKIKDSVENTFNLTEDLHPGECSASTGFRCLKFQKDSVSKKLFFSIERTDSQNIVITRVSTTKGTMCKSSDLNQLLSHDSTISLWLEDCSFSDNLSEVKTDYYPLIGSSRGLDRYALFDYMIKEED